MMPTLFLRRYLVSIFLVPLIPALVWRFLYFRAVRRRVIADALKAAHRACPALRGLAVKLLLPQPEEDPLDFPAFHVGAAGEPPRPPLVVRALRKGSDDEDRNGDAGLGKPAVLALQSAEDVQAASVGLTGNKPPPLPPAPHPATLRPEAGEANGRKASLADGLRGGGSHATDEIPLVPGGLATQGPGGERKRSKQIGAGPSGGASRGVRSAGASSGHSGGLASAVASAQRLRAAFAADQGNGAAPSEVTRSGRDNVTKAIGAPAEEEREDVAMLAALLGGGLQVKMTSEEPAATEEEQPVPAPGPEGAPPRAALAKSGKRRAMPFAMAPRSRTTTPKSEALLGGGGTKSGARLNAYSGARSAPRSLRLAPGASSGARTMLTLAAEAAAAKRGSLDGALPASAQSGLRPGRSGHSSGVHSRFAPSAASNKEGGGAQSALEAEVVPNHGGAAAGVVAEVTSLGTTGGDPLSSAVDQGSRPQRKVVKKKLTDSHIGSEAADAGVASVSDVQGGGPPKKKKVVKRLVVKKVLRTRKKPANGGNSGAPLSPDSIPITIDSGCEGGTSVETPRRPPALRIKPTAAADRSSEERLLRPTNDRKRASADGAPPPLPPALPMQPMNASSTRESSGRDSSLNSRALVAATSPETGTAAFSKGTSTARAAFLSFFGRSATPGTAGRARSGAKGFFGTGLGAASGARPVSGRAGFRSHFVGDRRAGGWSTTNAKSSLLLLTAPRSAQRRSADPSIIRIPRLEATKEDLELETQMEEAARDTRLNEEGEDTTRLYINYFVRAHPPVSLPASPHPTCVLWPSPSHAPVVRLLGPCRRSCRLFARYSSCALPRSP